MDLETSIAHNSKVLFCDLVIFSTKLFNLAITCTCVRIIFKLKRLVSSNRIMVIREYHNEKNCIPKIAAGYF